MSRFTALSLAVVGLAVLACGTILAQEGEPGGRHAGPRAGRVGPPGPSEADKEKARIRIGITKEQQRQLEAILEETGKQSRAVFEQIREKHRQLHDLYDSYEIDRQREKTLMREITRLRMSLLKIQSEHETKVRQVLTKEQHERLRALMKEAMEEARKRWGNRPPPPPGRDMP